MAEVTSFRFDYSDLALSWDGRWREVECGNAQYATLTNHSTPREFYELLEQEVLRGPDMPEWTWCLVGDIVQTHEFGEERRVVRGTRHFRPGTKVYVSNAFWGQGGECVCAIGVPRYCDHLVGVHMDSTLIENYRLEKVADREVLRALFTNRLQEEFAIDRQTDLRTCWGAGERSRGDIEANAEYRNSE